MQEAVCLQAEWKDTCLQAGKFEHTYIHLDWNAKANYCKNCQFFQQSKTLLAGIMRGIPAFRQVILYFLLHREIIRGKYFEFYESLLKYKILPAGRIGRLPGLRQLIIYRPPSIDIQGLQVEFCLQANWGGNLCPVY